MSPLKPASALALLLVVSKSTGHYCIDMYVEVLADGGDVAMMVIDWDGSIYRNESALKKLQAMWRHSFDTNVQTLVPILSDHISQKYLGVAGIKWLPAPSD